MPKHFDTGHRALQDGEKARLDEALKQSKDVTIQPSTRAKARTDAARKFVKSLLLINLASSPRLQTGAKLHEDDQKAIVEEVIAEAKKAKVPDRLLGQIRLTAAEVVAHVADGNRQAAELLASERSVFLGNELATAPQFEEPAAPDPGELAAQIAARSSGRG